MTNLTISNPKTKRSLMLTSDLSNADKATVQFGNFIGSLMNRKPRYHIENITVNEQDGTIEVEYCQEHDYQDFEKGIQSIDDIIWNEESISLAKLQDFALEEKMNHYCKDYVGFDGEHCQQTGAIPIEQLMDQYDFLHDAAKAYLEAGKEVE